MALRHPGQNVLDGPQRVRLRAFCPGFLDHGPFARSRDEGDFGMSSKVMLSVIVPTYNESENIIKLIQEIQKALEGAQIGEYEILVMDDGSPDGTAQLVNELGQGRVRAVDRSGRKKSLADAAFEGFSIAKGEVLAMMDADLSHPPSLLPELMHTIHAGANLAIASRYVQGGGTGDWPRHRVVISRMSGWAARLVTPVRDSGSGYILFRREVIDGVSLNPIGFKVGLEIIVKGRHQDRIVEVPYVWWDRKQGTSKLGFSVTLCYFGHLLMLIAERCKQKMRLIRTRMNP